MLLGKRPRPTMIKRTTSMTGITVVEVEAPPQTQTLRGYFHGAGHDDHNTPHFLRSCGLCTRPLAPGRDIYMYRGDTAFCSLECREQQMKQDDRKEKVSHQLMSSQPQADQEKNNHKGPHTNKNVSNKSPTVVAA